MSTQAVIFDLDGVIVSTDEFHFQGWKKLADEEGIHFDRQINHRLRGVSRMESLEILLERSPRRHTPEQKIALAACKNGYYVELLKNISPADILPGAMAILQDSFRVSVIGVIAREVFSRSDPFNNIAYRCFLELSLSQLLEFDYFSQFLPVFAGNGYRVAQGQPQSVGIKRHDSFPGID